MLRLRMLAVKNSMKRRDARLPASAISAGLVNIWSQDDKVVFASSRPTT